ncbi:MAG: hypothetical protein CVU88_02450 [Firmicutes bacterium HGW-Firmicutes-13]|nr:MAG: hypothetical protein CVU88_02450 [Firmicutes bacterium HGW-Firmicutes-13]
MIGLPASGKSTVCRDYQRKGYSLVNPDSIRLRFGVQFARKIEREVWTIAYAELKAFLKLGKRVVFDATNLTIGQRRPLIKIAKSYGARVTAHTMTTPLEECLKRNEAREYPIPQEAIIKKVDTMVPPSRKEGFDSIEKTEA